MNALSTQTLQVCRHVIASQVLSVGDPGFEESARLATQALRELDLIINARAAQAVDFDDMLVDIPAPGDEEDLAPPVAESPGAGRDPLYGKRAMRMPSGELVYPPGQPVAE